MEHSILNMLITWLVSGLVGAFGVGVGYATLRGELKHFHKEFTTYKDVTAAAAATATLVALEQFNSEKSKLAKLGDKVSEGMAYEKCRDLRLECGNRISAQLNEMTKQVGENRGMVSANMLRIEGFMGRVEEFMKAPK